MPSLKLGKTAPNFILQSTEGERISLNELLGSGNHVLLVFLRHLGWIPCREHVAQLCQQQNQLQEQKTRVIIISFGTLPAVQEWMRENCSHFTILLNRKREIYKAYGLETSIWRAYHPRILWLYFKVLLSGRKMHDSHGDDTTQLGGDFIVGKDGKMKLLYPSYDPTDRPPVEDLLKVLDRL